MTIAVFLQHGFRHGCPCESQLIITNNKDLIKDKIINTVLGLIRRKLRGRGEVRNSTEAKTTCLFFTSMPPRILHKVRSSTVWNPCTKEINQTENIQYMWHSTIASLRTRGRCGQLRQYYGFSLPLAHPFQNLLF